MQPERFVRLLPVSIFITAISGFVLYLNGNNDAAIGLLLGGLWSACNLWVLYKLVKEVFFQHRPMPIILLAQLKLPVLYGLGYLAIAYINMDMVWTVVGFHIPVILIVFTVLIDVKNRASEKE